jgi:hypothetical protein
MRKSLLTEASLDDQFNVQMSKIQEAIIKLEKIAKNFESETLKPVRSQKSALEAASQDLVKIRNLMFNLA